MCDSDSVAGVSNYHTLRQHHDSDVAGVPASSHAEAWARFCIIFWRSEIDIFQLSPICRCLRTALYAYIVHK